MRRVFADTHYYLALMNADDDGHATAVRLTRELHGAIIITSDWIITEMGDAFCSPINRPAFRKMHQLLHQSNSMIVVPFGAVLFDAGISLFNSRPDKSWSLTDCVSFVIMEQHNISEALTADRHFAQAGFSTLF